MKPLDSDLLYLDNHLLIVDKPPLLLTQPTDLENDSLQTRVKSYLKEKYNKPGEVFVHPVHRLDRVAAGIVVFARTSKALSRLNEQIRQGQWKKTYLLRHEGRLPKKEGSINSFLLREEYRTVVVSEGTPGSKAATLHYKSLSKDIAKVDLETGRYHQIRAQFASIGCPICGDEKYGAKTSPLFEGIDLVHASIELIHPVTHKPICIQSKRSYIFHVNE